PATGRRLVHRAVVDEVVELALLELVARGEPRRAMEAVGLGPGEAGLDRRRHAHELAIDVTHPRLAAAVDDLVAHLHRVVAAGERIGAANGEAVRAGPLERHLEGF